MKRDWWSYAYVTFTIVCLLAIAAGSFWLAVILVFGGH